MGTHYWVYSAETYSPDSLSHRYLGTVSNLEEARALLGRQRGHAVNTDTGTKFDL